MRPPRWITSRDKGRTAVVDLHRKASTTGHLLQALLVHHLGYDLSDVLEVEVEAPGTVKVITPALDADGKRYVDVWGDLATDTHRHDVIWPTDSGRPSGLASGSGPQTRGPRRGVEAPGLPHQPTPDVGRGASGTDHQ